MYYKAAETIKNFAKENCPGVNFHIALVLGSGLGGFPSLFENVPSLSYADIEGMAVSTAPGHEGRLYFIKIGSNGVLCFSGRTHYYEGKGIDKVVYPVRVMKAAGVDTLFITNASGGINPRFNTGDLMLINDHINFLPNPLVGPNDANFGVRFPDMTQAYDRSLGALVKATAGRLGIYVREGVYMGLTGPSYETPAEIRAFRTLGADAVGMSTVPEVIVARHCGIKVCGISLIANAAAGMNAQPLSEQEVIDAGKNASALFGNLMKEVLSAI